MTTLEELNAQLQDWKEKAYQSDKWNQRLKQLRQQRNEKNHQIVKLEVALEMENEDIEKLTGFTWTNLFHTLLRSKEDQMDLERQQALAAALRLQEAKQTLTAIEEEIRQTGEKLSLVIDAQREYERAAKRKESWLIEAALPEGKRLLELDEAILEHSLLIKEITEAVNAGDGLRSSLQAAVGSLEKAGNWGTWDMLGGGMISTAIKHGHIDDAKDDIHNAQARLHSFERELNDLHQICSIRIETGGFPKFADFFFDGLIADWVMQGRIRDSLNQVQTQLHKVNAALDTLRRRQSAAEQERSRLAYERAAVLEQAK